MCTASKPGAAPQANATEACRVLVADDQRDILEAVGILLRPQGYIVDAAHSPREVLALLASESYDAALLDLNYSRDTTSGTEGLALVDEIAGSNPRLPLIVMTAWANIDLAVEAM